MKKRGLSSAIALPTNLCGVHAYVEEESRKLHQPTLSEAERQETLLDKHSLRDLKVGTAEDFQLVYRGAQLPSGQDEIKTRLGTMTLRTSDELLRAFVGCQLHGINPDDDDAGAYVSEFEDELEDTAAALCNLETWDRDRVYAHTMAGALASAGAAVPRTGYPDHDADRADVGSIVHHTRHYWIAHDLQLFAHWCRDMLRSPTGNPALDGDFTGHLARSGSAAKVIDDDVSLARQVVEAYKKMRISVVLRAPNTTLSFGSSLNGGAVFRSAETFSARRDLPANDALVKKLEGREEYFTALEQLVTWRLEHGGHLEDYLDWEMTRLEHMLPHWGRKVKRIRENRTLRNQRLVNCVLPLHPLELLYLACERAILWCDVEPGRTLNNSAALKLSKSQSKRVHRLFFALRFGIVGDSNSIPRSLQSDATTINGNAVRSDGSTLSFAEVFAAGLERGDFEKFSNNFSSNARTFAMTYRRHEMVVAAWGTIGWRLQQ